MYTLLTHAQEKKCDELETMMEEDHVQELEERLLNEMVKKTKWLGIMLLNY